MASIQLSFSIRTSANVKTVHLLGSWNNYSGQLPLSKDASKEGSWKGTFRFQGASLKPGQRYWYYYIIDGYHVSHDPAQPSTLEPTTKRNLNILDVPTSGTTGTASKRNSACIPKGRPISPSRIVHPKPYKPNAVKTITGEGYDQQSVEALTARFGAADLSSDEYDSEFSDDDGSDLSSNPPSSAGSSVSSRSSSSSPSSLSSYSSSGASRCSCERYGITRKGDRVKLDCGGARCGYSDDSSSACSSDDSEGEYVNDQSTRRQGIVVRR